MLNTMITILGKQQDINGYKIYETKIESNELFFIKKNVDMDRAKKVHHYKLTVYTDFEEEGKKYKGSATTFIHPTMSENEVVTAIRDAAFAAKFVKNPYYPLVKPITPYQTVEKSNFSKESLSVWMNRITEAIYKNDIYDKGGINSCEIFLNREETHIVTSEGVDATVEKYRGMVEFITTWKEEGDEIELYRCLHFSEFNPEELSGEVETMINICKEKAIAKNTPAVHTYPVLLTREAVKEFFSFYYDNSSAANIYNQSSTWKIGDPIQGDDVKGDTITMTLDPFLNNSTYSAEFDEDGFPLATVKVIDQGKLIRYHADTRFAHYLSVEPTGTIHNIVIPGGKHSMDELKKEPHLEAAAFSDFNVDDITGDFCGEIRLAWYYDGKKTVPVTGGSISGNIKELQKELYLSKELQRDNYFEGPKAIKLLNVTVAGIE